MNKDWLALIGPLTSVNSKDNAARYVEISLSNKRPTGLSNHRLTVSTQAWQITLVPGGKFKINAFMQFVLLSPEGWGWGPLVLFSAVIYSFGRWTFLITVFVIKSLQGPSFLPAGKASQVAKKNLSNIIAAKTVKVQSVLLMLAI